MPGAARASWIRWGVGLSLALPPIVAGVFLATSLMRMPLSSRHDVPPLLAFAIMSVFAIAVGGVPAWLLITRALRDAGPRSLLLGLAIEAASCVLCFVIAGIQNAANPREGGGGMAFVALGSAFGLTTVVFIPLALAAMARARLTRAAGRQPHVRKTGVSDYRGMGAMASVLVAYATKYGSTREVAEAVVTALHERGVEAVARPAGEVRDLEGFSAVVLGTALYFFRWRGEAHRFLRHNRRRLAGLPVAVFGLGPIEDTPEQFDGARGHLDKGLAKHPWLSPVSIAVFGGRFDPTGLHFPDNNPAMRQMAPCDLRDFDAIGSWARSLVDVLDARPERES